MTNQVIQNMPRKLLTFVALRVFIWAAAGYGTQPQYVERRTKAFVINLIDKSTF